MIRSNKKTIANLNLLSRFHLPSIKLVEQEYRIVLGTSRNKKP